MQTATDEERPFLEIVTRCYQRLVMRERNIASVKAMAGDVYHAMIFDRVGRGIGASYAALAQYEPYGQWVWVLDDDDECIYPALAADISRIAAECNPDVVMLRMDHGNGGILPDKFHWQKPPEMGYIGVSAFVVTRAVWLAHRGAFASARYQSDFDFINAVFAADLEAYWHDITASRVQRANKKEAQAA